MAKIKYRDAKPIVPSQATVWLIELPSGEKHIQVWAKGATIEDVHNSCVYHYGQFVLSSICVGGFAISKVEHLYARDGRAVNRDWDVVI